MATSAALVVQEIETIIRTDCNAMVFPLRADTLAKLDKIVNEYGNDRYDAGNANGYEEAMQVRLGDEF